MIESKAQKLITISDVRQWMKWSVIFILFCNLINREPWNYAYFQPT